MADYIQGEQAFEEAASPESGAQRTYRREREDDIQSRITAYLKSRMSDQVILTGVKMRKAAKSLHDAGNCFSEDDQRVIGEYINKAADRIDRMSSYLQDTPLERIKEDARDVSSKQPWLFMGASLASGIVLARVLKASQNRR
ncbi:MAG: hypothetical protein R6U50_18350 [Desulfobacterales bacterium]